MKVIIVLALVGGAIWAFSPTNCNDCSHGYYFETKTHTCSTCKGRGEVTCTNSRSWFDEVEPGTFAIGTVKGPNGKRGFSRSYRCDRGRLVSNYDHFNGRTCNKCQGTKKHNCESCNGYGKRTSKESVRHDACNGTGEITNIQALFQ